MKELIRIRKCEERDREAFISMNLMFMEAVRKEHVFWDNLKFPTKNEMNSVFSEAMSMPYKIQIFMVENKGTPIGYVNTWIVYSIWSMGKSMIIDDLFIHPNYRNMGVGKLVMGYLIDYAEANEFKRIQLHTETDNDIAQKLYKDQGFEGTEMVVFMKNINDKL